MVSGISLLSTIPFPVQNVQAKTPAPVASVRVGDITDGEIGLQDNCSFFNKLVDNLREKLIQKRIKKLESIPPELRTPAQQSELDANNQAMNCNYMI